MDAPAKPRPTVDNPDHSPFWEGTQSGELRVQRCRECGRFRWPPHPSCPGCRSFTTEWVTVAPTGRLFTWNICNQAMHPSFKEDVPFAIVIVALDEAPGVRMLGNLIGRDFDRLRADLPMRAVFQRLDAEVTLVQWEPIEG